MKNNLSVSNILILISIIFTIVSFLFPEILAFGMNRFFYFQGNYIKVFIQFCSYSFLHGGLLHLFSNSIFVYFIGNQLENNIGKTKYIWFFILNTIFVGIAILTFSNANTIGISGFVMAILSYYIILLKKQNNEEYKIGISILVINIFMGLSGGISFVGHLFGGIFGILYYLIVRNLKNKNLK